MNPLIDLWPAFKPRGKYLEKHGSETLYNKYHQLIKKHFIDAGLKEWRGNDNSDPSSPGSHYISRNERGKILGLIPTQRNIAVMEIESEPKFADGFVECNVPCTGLKMRICDKNYKKMILKFAEEYENIFKEKIQIG